MELTAEWERILIRKTHLPPAVSLCPAFQVENVFSLFQLHVTACFFASFFPFVFVAIPLPLKTLPHRSLEVKFRVVSKTAAKSMLCLIVSKKQREKKEVYVFDMRRRKIGKPKTFNNNKKVTIRQRELQE